MKKILTTILAMALAGGVWGGMLGLAAGFGCMLSMVGSPVLFLVLLPAFGFLSGVLANFLINRRFVSYLILAALALLLRPFCRPRRSGSSAGRTRRPSSPSPRCRRPGRCPLPF